MRRCGSNFPPRRFAQACLSKRLDGEPLAFYFRRLPSGRLLRELFGKSDEDAFGTTDVAEPIHVLVPDDFADQLRAALDEPDERIVDILDGKHDTQVTESVHWGVAVIGDHGRREETG